MSKSKFIASIVLILGLGGFSLYLNKDRFKQQTIQISHRINPSRARGGSMPITFVLNGYHRLKSVRVVDAAAYATNKYALPVWRLVTESNSAPVSTFDYGNRIRGMHPETKGLQPEPLRAGVTYCLLLETARGQKAEHNFVMAASGQ